MLLAALSLTGCWNVGRGEKVGTIIKLAQEGSFIKTWEFEMVRGGMNGGNGSFSVTPVNITVEDTSLLPVVQEAFDSQREVIVTYEEEKFAPLRSDTENKFLTSIKFRDQK